MILTEKTVGYHDPSYRIIEQSTLKLRHAQDQFT